MFYAQHALDTLPLTTLLRFCLLLLMPPALIHAAAAMLMACYIRYAMLHAMPADYTCQRCRHLLRLLLLLMPLRRV